MFFLKIICLCVYICVRLYLFLSLLLGVVQQQRLSVFLIVGSLTAVWQSRLIRQEVAGPHLHQREAGRRWRKMMWGITEIWKTLVFSAYTYITLFRKLKGQQQHFFPLPWFQITSLNLWLNRMIYQYYSINKCFTGAEISGFQTSLFIFPFGLFRLINGFSPAATGFHLFQYRVKINLQTLKRNWDRYFITVNNISWPPCTKGPENIFFPSEPHTHGWVFDCYTFNNTYGCFCKL